MYLFTSRAPSNGCPMSLFLEGYCYIVPQFNQRIFFGEVSNHRQQTVRLGLGPPFQLLDYFNCFFKSEPTATNPFKYEPTIIQSHHNRSQPHHHITTPSPSTRSTPSIRPHPPLLLIPPPINRCFRFRPRFRCLLAIHLHSTAPPPLDRIHSIDGRV